MFGTYFYSQLLKGILQIISLVVIGFLAGFGLGALIF